jgi:DNA polymerase III epsilon subunit-like protein
MSRCQVILKSGKRTGKRCNRLNCVYHMDEYNQSESEMTSSVESIQGDAQSPSFTTESNLTPVTLCLAESIPEESKETESTQEEYKQTEPTQESVQEEYKVSEPIPDEHTISEAVTEEHTISEAVTEERQTEIVTTVAQEPEVDPVVQEEVSIGLDAADDVSVQAISPEDEYIIPDFNQREDILVIDTETTGLPPPFPTPIEYPDRWPRLVQIAWERYSQDGELKSKKCFIIKPDFFHIPKEASDIHGITKEVAMQKGVPIQEMFVQLSFELYRTKTIVSHNVEFDSRIIQSELFRYSNPELATWKERTFECTMQLAKYIGLVPSNTKLGVLYEMCIKKDPPGNLHQADVDTTMCAELYFYFMDQMKKKVYLQIPYSNNDIVKHLGAKWDSEKKLWFTYESNRFLAYLLKWFPTKNPSVSIFDYFSSSDVDIQLYPKDETDCMLIQHLGGKKNRNSWSIVKGNPFEKYLLQLFPK